LILLVVLGSTARVLVADSAAVDPEARRQFIAAHAEARRGSTGASQADSESLEAYPLYPYLLAARLENRLNDPAAASEIQAFLDRHGDEPAARKLRRQWLMSLALRKQWEPYLAAYRADVDDSAAGRCNMFAARIALHRTAGMMEEVAESWLTPRSLPPACDPAFDWLAAQGGITPEMHERRARAALAAGEASLARYLARSMPEATAASINQWASLIEQPRASVESLIAAPGRPVEPAALLDGWRRYARADTDGAATRYAALLRARSIEPQAAGPYALAVAVPYALSRDSRALGFFALAKPEDFDERAHEWHVRAALWAADWPRARAAIEAMPESLRSQNRWRYWQARALEQLDDKDAARAGYASVVPTDNWYAVLSAARLGQPFAPTLQPVGLSVADMNRLAGELPFVRARELILCDMEPEAIAEWRAAYDGLPAADQVQAIGLASRWDWHLQAISAAAKLGLFNDYDLLYPRPYDAEVRRGAVLSRLSEDLVYAVIRQESLYKADARSSAGALGLMQLLPSTAQSTARRWGLPVPTRSSLLVPSVNVPLGSAFLSGLIERAEGQKWLAIAGYNAGPGAVRRWLPTSPMATDVWVENIPYNETRAYVQRVSWHALVFGWLGERKPRDVSDWLGVVRAPALDDTPQPAG
jgi:soluble lytic murein transglycosylase